MDNYKFKGIACGDYGVLMKSSFNFYFPLLY